MNNEPKFSYINQRAIIIAACTFLILLLASIYAVASLRSVISRKDRVSFDYTETLLDVEKLSLSAEKKEAATRGYLLSPDENMYEDLLKARSDFLIALNELKDEVTTPVGRKYLVQIEDAEKNHQFILDNLILRRQKDESLGSINRDFRKLLIPRRIELDNALKNFERFKHARMDQMRAISVEKDDFAMRIIFLISFIIIISILILGFFVIKLLKKHRRDYEEIALSKTRFTDLVNHLDHSIVWEANADPFEFKFVSERSQFLLGVPGNDWIQNKQSFFNLIPEEDQDKVRAMLKRAANSMKDERCVHRMITVDGKTIWLQSGVHPTLKKNGSVDLYGLSMDITPLKTVQENLKQTQLQFNSIMENATSFIYIKDIKGRYTFINREAAQQLRIAGTSMIGKTDEEIFRKDIAVKIKSLDEEVLRSGQAIETEETFEADGVESVYFSVKFPLIDANGYLYGMGGIATNITERRNKMEDLRHSEERLGLAIKFSGMGIWDWNLREQNLIWNENTEEIFDYKTGSVNHPFSDFENRLHVEDKEIVAKTLQEAMDNHQDFRSEFRIVTSQGIKWIISLGRAIYDQDKKPCRMVGIVIDISDRKLFEKKLQASVRAREEVLAVVSHDLRNPLGVMLMSAGMIERRLKDGVDDEWIRKQADKIKQAGKRMNELIEDLLSLTKIEAGHFTLVKETYSIKDLMSEVHETTKSLAQEKNLRVELSFTQEDKTVEVDHHQILRVFGNIISNGIKFSPQDGLLKLSAHYNDSDVIFCISDTGPGIAEHHLNNVFERFWQAQGTAHKGTGLGMAIAKGITKAHGGQIWVRSVFGEGATFCVSLPMKSVS